MNLDQLPLGYAIDPDGVARRSVSRGTPARARRRKGPTEAEWQADVEALAATLGWWAWHDNDPRRNVAGFPDLLLVRERVVWAELKTETGVLRPGQAIMRDRLIAAGAEWHLWRPSDLDDVTRALT